MNRENWKYLSIGDCASVVGGGTPSTKNPEYWDGDISWISPKDLSNNTNKYVSRGERFITKKGLENSSAKILPENSLLFSSRAPIGYLAINTQPMATNQGFKSLILKDEFDVEFFYYLFKQKTEYIKNFSSGSTFQEISGSEIKNLKFLIPPYKEQKQISNILSKLDKKIELNQKMNETLEDIGKTLFKSWFIDFDPVRAKSEGRPTGLSKEISDLFPDSFDDSELGEIPIGWKNIKLGDIASVTSGKRPSEIEEVESSTHPYEVFGGAGPIGFCNNFLEFKKPAIITGRVGTLGKVFFLDKECWVSDNSILICDGESYTPIIFQTLKYTNLSSLNVGSTQPLLTGRDIKNINIISPDKLVLDRYVSTFNKIKTRQNQLNNENKIILKLRDTLLPKLMSGEIDIPEAEDIIEEKSI